MKQASFQIGNSVNKEKNNVSEPNISVQKEVNKNIEKLSDNKNTIINDTKIYNKPRKLVENIYYF
jgi:hypothetical protein